jgi:hypothetical protein
MMHSLTNPPNGEIAGPDEAIPANTLLVRFERWMTGIVSSLRASQ